MKRLQPQQEKAPRFKIFQVVKIGAIVLAVFLVFEVWMVNRLATMGAKIAQLDQVKNSLDLENQLLESQIAQKSALNNIDQKASDLGFKPIGQVESINSPKIAAAN